MFFSDCHFGIEIVFVAVHICLFQGQVNQLKCLSKKVHTISSDRRPWKVRGELVTKFSQVLFSSAGDTE